ncbi:hypothetical protein cypCar_00004063 [Cyprinus carpio]|nr:hypothetical protein cypCar_00004063 [Cyprinus carpio]
MYKTSWILNRLIHTHSGVSKHRSVVRLWSSAAEGAVAPPAVCRITDQTVASTLHTARHFSACSLKPVHHISCNRRKNCEF